MTVGVVGAGITGLTLTHELCKRGVDVLTVEAREEPGGVIRSDRIEGRRLEYGPQRIRRVPAIGALIDELGLESEVLVAKDDLPLYVYRNNRLREVPRSLSAVARTDLLSWRGKLRLFAEPMTGPIRPDERAADAFRRKFGSEAYHAIIAPLFGGVYASDPAEMPAKHSLSRLMALEERHGSLLRAAISRLGTTGERAPPMSFRDGLQTLPAALSEAHAGSVHLGTPLNQVIDRADEAGYQLVPSPGAGAAGPWNVDDLVVTAPAHETAELLEALPDATVAPLEELRYNPLAMVHLRASTDANGFGYQVSREESLRTLGVTWNASLFDRGDVYTAFLGGMDDPEILDRTNAELGRIAREEFTAVMDAPATVVDVTTWTDAFPAHDTSWSALERIALPDDIHLPTNFTGGIGVPSRVREASELAEELTR